MEAVRVPEDRKSEMNKKLKDTLSNGELLSLIGTEGLRAFCFFYFQNLKEKKREEDKSIGM